MIIANAAIVLIGTIPAAISAVYKQNYLADRAMNMTTMNLMVAALQMLFGLFLFAAIMELQFIDSEPTIQSQSMHIHE